MCIGSTDKVEKWIKPKGLGAGGSGVLCIFDTMRTVLSTKVGGS